MSLIPLFALSIVLAAAIAAAPGLRPAFDIVLDAQVALPDAETIDTPLIALAPLPESVDPTPLEIALFDLVNRDRETHGLAPLHFDAELLGLARHRALAQGPEAPLTHLDDLGDLDFATGLAAEGVPFRVAAETLARVPRSDDRAAALAASALMSSESHRAVILQPSFDLLAVGAALDTQGNTIFAQLFRGLDPSIEP